MLRPDELRRMSREELLLRAAALGVERPTVLTQDELIDEILKRLPSDRAAAPAGVRGWLGRARDLVARVIERGLHLPDAARLLRHIPPAPAMPKPPPPLPTVTLAEIYAAQGYYAKAVAVLDEVLERRDDNDEARTLRMRYAAKLTPAELERARSAPEEPEPEEPEPEEPEPEPEEPEPAAPLAESPTIAVPPPAPASAAGADPAIDEVVAIATDPRTAYVYWELRPRTYARARWRDREGGLVLRALAVCAADHGTRLQRFELPLAGLSGDCTLQDLAPGAELRLCVAWKGSAGATPLVVAPELQMPRDYLAGDAVVRTVDAALGARR
jgi:hypothetical protein